MYAVDGEQVADEAHERHDAQDDGAGVRPVRQHRRVLQAVDGGVEVDDLPVGVVGDVHRLTVLQWQEDAAIRREKESHVHHGVSPSLHIAWEESRKSEHVKRNFQT